MYLYICFSFDSQWKGRVPDACKNEYPGPEQWRCYFGYRMYPTLKSM